MGATEEFDAVAVVVSEERGQISFVEGGNLTRDLDTSMLRKVLEQFPGRTGRGRSGSQGSLKRGYQG